MVFVSDGRMRDLNNRYRQIDRPTDVLSFPAMDGETAFPEDRSLGDVIISVETAWRQAEEAGHPLEAELDRLLVHGLLHLLGHDHQTAAERKQMQSRERRLLKSLNS